MDLGIAKLIADYGMGAVCLATLIVLHLYNVRVTLPTLSEKAQDQVDRLVKIFQSELAEERRQCHEDYVQLGQVLQHVRMDVSRLVDRSKER